MPEEERRKNAETRSRLEVIEKHWAGVQESYAAIAEAYGETTRVVKRGQRIQAAMFGVVFVLVIATIGTLYVLHRQGGQRARDQAALVGKNTKAIEVGCTLLVQLAAQTGATAGREGISEGAKLQRQITAAVVDVVLRSATPARRAKIVRLYRRLERAGPILTPPNCKQVAQHPEAVEQTGASTKQQSAPRP